MKGIRKHMELLRLKEAIGIITQRGMEQIVVESSINRGESMEVRNKESHSGSAHQDMVIPLFDSQN